MAIDAKDDKEAAAAKAAADDKAAKDQAAAPKAAAKTEEPTFKPITAEDEKANPVFVSVPKTPEEVAKEGTALGNAGAAATGGNPPEVTEDDAHVNKRIWSLDADHNTSLRNDEDAPGATKPDYVEIG